MRSLILALVISSFSAMAEQQTEFKNGAYCEPYGRGIESKLSEVTKTFEDEKDVVFTFKVTHGYCESIDVAQAPIQFQNKMAQISRYGFSLPGMRTHASIKIDKIDETHGLITMTFKKDALPRKFNFSFWALTWVGYKWVVEVSTKNENTEISFQGYEPL